MLLFFRPLQSYVIMWQESKSLFLEKAIFKLSITNIMIITVACSDTGYISVSFTGDIQIFNYAQFCVVTS